MEKMKEEVEQLENRLHKMQSEHNELHDFFEAEKSSLLESYEEEKSRFQEFHHLEKIECEETHRKQTQTLRELHQQEKTALQESHEEVKSNLRALYEQEKEILQKNKLVETKMLKTMTAEKQELQQENANVVEQLRNANLAKTAAEKQFKKLQDMLNTSVSNTRKTATLEMLDADALFQRLTKRIDQLVATESKMHSQEEQNANLRSQNECLESERNSLEIRYAELSARNEAKFNKGWAAPLVESVLPFEPNVQHIH